MGLAPRDTLLFVNVYYYSSGKEILEFSDKGEIPADYSEGELKVLLKIKKNNRLQETFFVSGRGKNKEEMLEDFSKNLRKALGW